MMSFSTTDRRTHDQILDFQPSTSARTEELFREHQHELHRQTDHLFAALMGLQWISGIVMALAIAPRTWIGASQAVHLHVWAAVVLGGLISSVPVVLAILRPGHTSTRHVMALAQGAWSGLLIHLSGGRIETHFHIFGSLAFLAFYRDWRVLLNFSVVAALDHFVRGVWWPLSVYGVAIESPYRWIEHGAWVIFEDIFLIISCSRGHRETHAVCERQAILEETNRAIERRVEERTCELETARYHLEKEFEQHRETQQEREQLYRELVTASRIAGMAEIATGVLHNVGNVLNSVNVSANLVMQRLQNSRMTNVARVSQVIARHEHNLAQFVTESEQGRKFPQLLEKLSHSLEAERDEQLQELSSLQANISHINAIVTAQQTYARGGGTTESIELTDLMEDALNVNEASLHRGEISIVRQFHSVPTIISDRHKLLQILVNLISNAKHALCESDQEVPTLTLSVMGDNDSVRLQVSDNGVGIPPELMTRMFTHGFTTRESGHGFGLHSCALAAQELGGSLSAHSEGRGLGAVFTLQIPVERVAPCPV